MVTRIGCSTRFSGGFGLMNNCILTDYESKLGSCVADYQDGSRVTFEECRKVLPTSYLPSHWPTYLPAYLTAYLPAYQPTYLPTYPPTTYQPTYQPSYLPAYLTAYLPTHPPTYLTSYPPTDLPTHWPTNLQICPPTYLHILCVPKLCQISQVGHHLGMAHLICVKSGSLKSFHDISKENIHEVHWLTWFLPPISA